MKSKPELTPSDNAPVSKTEESKEKKPRIKKSEYQGSRWSSFVILILIMLTGFILSLTGHR